MSKRTSSKPTDWVAVIMRAARHGLQIIPIDREQWDNITGSNARIVLDLDDNVIWMHENARVSDLEQALLTADYAQHPYLKRPTGIVHIGELGKVGGKPAVRMEAEA